MPMQPLTAPPRDHLSAQDVVRILQDAPASSMAAGLEMVDLGLNVLEDVSDDLAGGSITRNSYNELHASANLKITRVLDWGAGLMRPYLTLSAEGMSARFNLGVYHPSTPLWQLGESPPTYDVTGYDMLLRLRQPVGDAFGVAAGVSYLTAVEEILIDRGYQAYLIDPSSAATVLPVARTWAFDDSISWLTIVNNLLSSIGYAGIWSDWDGRLRAEPYILPAARSVEWTYTDDVATTMLGREGTVQHDFFDAPNRWVFYRSNRADETAPTEGNGRYTYVNLATGLTSVEARGGLEVTAPPMGVDVADQASLVVLAHQQIAADMDIPTVVERPTAINPLHWHFDRLMVRDSTSIVAADVQCTAWSITLAPEVAHMQQTWRVISL